MKEVYRLNKKSIFAILMALCAGTWAGIVWTREKFKILSREVSKEMVTDIIESMIPCSLIVITKYGQEEEKTITDFSQYEETGRVGLIIHKTGQHPGNTQDITLDDDILFYTHAVVYQVGDRWLWKVL